MKSLLYQILFGISLVFLTAFLFGSFYGVGDDIAMRILCEEGSNKLIWTKSILGDIYLFFPKIIFGFSRFDFVNFIFIGSSIGLIVNYFLENLKQKEVKNKYFIIGIIVFLLLLFVISPHYTNTAGLLTIAGVFSLLGINKNIKFLGIIAVIFGFCIRSEMTVVILIIMSPYWVYNQTDRRLILKQWILFAIIFFMINQIDKSNYTTDKFVNLEKRKEVISPFFDYQFAKKLLKRSNADLLSKSTLSINDVKLFNSHFYDWPKFDTLIPHLKEVQIIYKEERDYKSSRILSAILSLNYLKQSEIIYLCIALLLILSFSIKSFRKESYILLIVLIFGLLFFLTYGYIQRAFLFRLYITPITAILLVGVLLISDNLNKNYYLLFLIPILSHGNFHIQKHFHRLNEIKHNRKAWSEFENKNPVIASQLFCWGDGPDVISFYPVFFNDGIEIKNKYFGSLSYSAKDNHNSAINQLLQNKTIYLSTTFENLKMLKVFFIEKYNKVLNSEKIDNKHSIYTVNLNILK